MKIKATILSFALLSPLAFAQTSSDGYLTDSYGHVVKTASGLCVRTSSYNPQTTRHADCDPTVPVQVTKGPEPIYVPESKPEVRAETPVVNATKEISEEVLFAFDSSIISHQGRNTLHKLAADLKSLTIEKVVITGHADPIGSEAYNMRLSQRRAEAVKNFLLKSVDESQLSVVAQGETQVKKDCGDSQDRQSITCNAPNRRVEIMIKSK